MKRFRLRSMEPTDKFFVYHVVSTADQDYPTLGEKVFIEGSVRLVDDFKFVCLLPFQRGYELRLYVKRL